MVIFFVIFIRELLPNENYITGKEHKLQQNAIKMHCTDIYIVLFSKDFYGLKIIQTHFSVQFQTLGYCVISHLSIYYFILYIIIFTTRNYIIYQIIYIRDTII